MTTNRVGTRLCLIRFMWGRGFASSESCGDEALPNPNHVGTGLCPVQGGSQTRLIVTLGTGNDFGRARLQSRRTGDAESPVIPSEHD